MTRDRMSATTAGVILVAAGWSLGACGDSFEANCHQGPQATVEETAFAPLLDIDLAQMTLVASGVYIQDRTVGTGTEANTGNLLRVAYSGWLSNGRQFDSGTFGFELGAGAVISGWDLGVQGMRIGGVRTIAIAPARAFGPCDDGTIPGNSVVVFEVRLLDVN